MEVKTLIIGCKAIGHDSALFIVMPEKKEVFGLSTERLTRYKHDKISPSIVLQRFIEYYKIDRNKVERVVLANSFKEYDPQELYENAPEISYATRKLFPFKSGTETFGRKNFYKKFVALAPHLLGWRILLEKLKQHLGLVSKKPVEEIMLSYLKKTFPNAKIDNRSYDHHLCHALCAYMTSPFEKTTVFTYDGWGDDNCSRVYLIDRSQITLLASSPKEKPEALFPDGYRASRPLLASVGGIYQYFTFLLGFTPQADEGKVEALAAYGKPIPSLLEELVGLISIDENLSMNLDVEKAKTVLSQTRLEEMSKREGRENMAATVQVFLETVTKDYVPQILAKTGAQELALAGGVSANVINNLMIYEHMTENLHITPAMADDGSAQGAAYAYLVESKSDTSWLKGDKVPYLGTSYERKDIEKALSKYPDLKVEDLGERWPEKVAELLAKGKIGAIFHGRMEWGPRALGNRSIVADPRRKDFREKINKEIKRRPGFQPFCPSILAEEKNRLFEKAYLNKHMTCAFRMKKEFWDKLPSAIHIDGTARAQFVEKNDNPMYYRLLKKVKELTGFGVVINTSFNKHGRTIVESPDDAICDFLDTDMDYLAMEGLLVRRK